MPIWASSQQTYYVSPDGDNEKSGSITEPLQTLQEALDRAEPGDVIVLREGVYREHVRFNQHGLPDAPITIRAYTNEVPVIKGSRIVEGWQEYEHPIWMREGWTNRSQQVFVDGELLQQIGPGGDRYYFPIGLDIEDMVAGSFYHDTNTMTLYVWLPDGGDPNDLIVEASVGDFLPVLDLGEFYIVDGITVRHSNLIRFWPAVGLRRGGIFRNGDISWCDYTGISLQHGAKLLNSVVSFNGGMGVESGRSSNVVVRGNTISHNNLRGMNTSLIGAGAKFYAVSGILVESNLFHNNYGQALWIDMARDDTLKQVTGNIVQNTELHPLRPHGIIAGIFVEVSRNVLVANNLVRNNQLIGIHVAESDNVRVFNNTIAGTQGRYALEARLNPRWSPRTVHETNQYEWVSFTSNRCFNNIFYDNRTTADIRWPGESDATNMVVTGNQIDHNLYYRPGSTAVFESDGTVWSNLAEYVVATGFDIHSLAVDPRLNAPAEGNYQLTPESPAIDQGRLLPEIQDGVDLAGVSRLLFEGIDLGAYEFDGSPAAYEPSITITTSNVVCYDTLHIEGRNNANVVGEIRAWVSPPDNYMTATRTTETEWVLDELEMHPGIDYSITVYATNLYGISDMDRIDVQRGGVGTGRPEIGITTGPPFYTPDPTFPLAGTNNMHVSGDLFWTNYYNQAPVSWGSTPAGNPNWAFEVTGLRTGLNHVVVRGVNDWGVYADALAVINHGDTPVHYVSTNAPNPMYPYSSWETAARNIMDAVDAASDGDTVRVGPGIYDRGGRHHELGFSRVLLDKGITLESVDGPEHTVIWGYREGSPQSTRGVLMIHSNAVLRGFTIQNGRTLSGLHDYQRHGGGVLAMAAEHIDNCILRNNTALPWGAGGGLMTMHMSGVLSNIRMENNRAFSGGGGAILWGGNTIADRLVFLGNEALSGGGGLWLDNCTRFYNALVVSNFASQWGGGIAIENNAIAWNTTVHGNAAGQGGGIAFRGNIGTVRNMILSGNHPPDIWALSNQLPHRVEHSIVEVAPPGHWPSQGTFLDLSPGYRDPGTNDFRLTHESPARDRGLDALWQLNGFDLDGNARRVGPAVDIGAYEYWEAAWMDLSMTGYLAGTCMPARISLSWAPDRELELERIDLHIPELWEVCSAEYEGVSLVVDEQAVVLPEGSFPGGSAIVDVTLRASVTGTGIETIYATALGTLLKDEVYVAVDLFADPVEVETFYWLQIDQVGQGEVLATDSWIAPQQEVLLAAVAEPGWRLRGWLGDTDNAVTNTDGSIVVVMDQDRNIRADFVELVELEIISEYDAVTPVPGVHIVDRGDRVVFDGRSVVTEIGRHYVVADWVGTGSIPSAGIHRAFSVLVDGPSAIEWRWSEVSAEQESRGYRVSGTPRTVVDVAHYHDPEANVYEIWYRPELPEGSVIRDVSGDGNPSLSGDTIIATPTGGNGWTYFSVEIELPWTAAGLLSLSGKAGINQWPEEQVTEW